MRRVPTSGPGPFKFPRTLSRPVHTSENPGINIGWYSMMQVFLVKKTTLFLFAAVVWVLGAITCGIYGVQLLNEGSDIQGICAIFTTLSFSQKHSSSQRYQVWHVCSHVGHRLGWWCSRCQVFIPSFTSEESWENIEFRCNFYIFLEVISSNKLILCHI